MTHTSSFASILESKRSICKWKLTMILLMLETKLSWYIIYNNEKQYKHTLISIPLSTNDENTFEKSSIASPSKYKNKHFQFLFPPISPSSPSPERSQQSSRRKLSHPRSPSFDTYLKISFSAKRKKKKERSASVRRFLTAPPPITKWRDKRKWRRSTRRGIPRSGYRHVKG